MTEIQLCRPATNHTPKTRVLPAAVLLALVFAGSDAHAQLRMWKRGAGPFNAVLYLQNNGGQAQQCAVSWANANGGFGNSRTVIVQPGQTQQIETGIVAINEGYRCQVYVDPFKQRQEEERRRRELEAQRRQQQEQEKQRAQQLWQQKPQQNLQPQQQGSVSQQYGNPSPQSYVPAPAYTAPSPAPAYIPPAAPATNAKERNVQMLGAMGQMLDAMSRDSETRRQNAEREAQAYRQQEEQRKRNTEQVMQRALQDAENAPDVNPWGAK